MLKVLEGFHHRAVQQITEMTAKHGADGEWDYPSVVEAMEAAGIHPIGVYIRRREATMVEMVAYRPIYEMCMETDRITGTSRLVRWWDQDTVNEAD